MMILQILVGLEFYNCELCIPFLLSLVLDCCVTFSDTFIASLNGSVCTIASELFGLAPNFTGYVFYH